MEKSARQASEAGGRGGIFGMERVQLARTTSKRNDFFLFFDKFLLEFSEFVFLRFWVDTGGGSEISSRGFLVGRPRIEGPELHSGQT